MSRLYSWVCRKCLARHPGEVEIKTIGNGIPRHCAVCERLAPVGDINMVARKVALHVIALYRGDLALTEAKAAEP